MRLPVPAQMHVLLWLCECGLEGTSDFRRLALSALSASKDALCENLRDIHEVGRRDSKYMKCLALPQTAFFWALVAEGNAIISIIFRTEGSLRRAARRHLLSAIWPWMNYIINKQ